jgi:hypothetical protein
MREIEAIFMPFNVVLTLGLLALISEPALAQCASNMCSPQISDASHLTDGIHVHWLPGGGTPPQRVALVQAGTDQKGFRDGKTLTSASETSSLGQYTSSDLHITVPANTSFSDGTLHVIGYWGNESIASMGFGVSPYKQEGDAGIYSTQSWFDEYGRIDLTWAGPALDHYNVRWSAGTSVESYAQQRETKGTVFIWRPSDLGPYTFIVQGCDRTPWGNSVECTKWSNPNTVYATPLPPPQITSLHFPHESKGDCELDGATIQFKSNGSGQFSARVKTNHTHTGDVWHTTIAGRNAAGQDVVSLPTFDSMRMDDDHGYYPWTVDFEFDPTKWSQIGSAYSKNGC